MLATNTAFLKLAMKHILIARQIDANKRNFFIIATFLRAVTELADSLFLNQRLFKDK